MLFKQSRGELGNERLLLQMSGLDLRDKVRVFLRFANVCISSSCSFHPSGNTAQCRCHEQDEEHDVDGDILGEATALPLHYEDTP